MANKALLVCGGAAAAWIVAMLVLGWDDVAGALGQFGVSRFALVAGLSLANYALRFRRWAALLRTVGAEIAPRPSLAVYFAAYVMVITPGKVGEVFKAAILRDDHGVPLARGLPVVLAERIHDFLAVLVLGALGLAIRGGPRGGAATALGGAGLVAVLLLASRSRPLLRRLVSRAAGWRHLRDHRVALDDALSALGCLFAPRPGSVHLTLSVVAWFCECAGLWVICRTLAPAVTLGDAVFVYAAATLAGSAAMLPGGLGGTEAVIVLLLAALGVPAAAGAAVAFIIRLATLWLAVIVGLTAFVVFRDVLLRKPLRRDSCQLPESWS